MREEGCVTCSRDLFERRGVEREKWIENVHDDKTARKIRREFLCEC